MLSHGRTQYQRCGAPSLSPRGGAGVVGPRMLMPSPGLPERRMPNDIQSDPRDFDPRSTLEEIGSLQSDRAHRTARQTFFVEGVRNVVQAIENGFRIDTLVYSDRLLTVPLARKLVRDRRRSGTTTV